MSETKTIMRLATYADLEFIKDCYHNSATCNEFVESSSDYFDSFTTPQEEFAYYTKMLNERSSLDKLYIVNRNGFDISLLASQFNEISKTTGGIVFTHPRACKMSVIASLKVLTIHNFLLIKNGYAESIYMKVWHPLMSQAVTNVIKDFKSIKLYTAHYVLFCMSSEIRNSFTEDYMKEVQVRNIDQHMCFECSL